MDKKLRILGIGVMGVVFLSLILVLSIWGAQRPKPEPPDRSSEAKIPSANVLYEGEDYQGVVKKLEEAGFTDIETKALNDLLTGWLKKDGSVKEVEVDGRIDYSAGTWFPKDVKIIVSYHSFPPRDTTTNRGNEPAYEIVKIVKGIGKDRYWVLTDEFDFSTDAYKKQVKAIISEIARQANTIELNVEVVTNRDIIERELDWGNALPTEWKYWVASYTGDSGYVVSGSMIEIDPAHEGFDYYGSVRKGRVFQISWRNDSPYGGSIEDWQPYYY